MSRKFKKICVVGLGYIGLPTAAMFASRRLQVIGVDVSEKVVQTVNEGEVHIVEPDLDIVVRAVVREGLLRAVGHPEEADAFLIAVPTPFKGAGHDPDLSFVEAAVHSIAPVLKAGDLVILESTSPVGATESMADWLAEARPDLTFPQICGPDSDIRIAHCPERVLPGSVMQELVANDRLIGGMTAACSREAADLYRVFVTGDCVIASGPRVAELAKLTENSFRDVNIAFANELSLVCDHLGIDVWELLTLANRHPRVNILRPGPGVGGHCIAVDPWFIVSSAPEQTPLIRAAREVNDTKPRWVIDKVHGAIGSYLTANPKKTAADVRIALYGLAFKSDIDDLRESPALEIAKTLALSHPRKVLAVEPNITDLTGIVCDGLELTGLEIAMLDADIHVVLVDHTPFKLVPPPLGIIIDTKGIWAP